MRPLVAVVISFLAGIIFARETGLSYRSAAAAFVAFFILIFLDMFRGRRFTRRLTLPLYFLLGAIFILPHVRPVHPPFHITRLMGAEEAANPAGMGDDVEGTVVGSERRGAGVRLRVRTERINLKRGWTRTIGDVLLSVRAGKRRFVPGERVRFLSRLREPWNFGNPGEFDYRGWLNMRGVFATGTVADSRLIVRLSEAKGVRAYAFRARERVGGFIDSHAVNAPLLKAMITGERDSMETGLREAFARTGTAHVLAISGLHAGMAALFSYAMVLFLMKRSERLMLAVNARKAAALVSLVPLLAYAALSGFSLSTERATIMAGAFVVTYVIGRGRDVYNTLALAALVILVLAPYSVWDVSFQLTFVASLMIVYLSPRIRELIIGDRGAASERVVPASWYWRVAGDVMMKRLLPLVCVTFAAGLGVSPLLAWNFNRVSLVGFAANLVVVPLTGLMVPLLLVYSAVLPLWEGLAWVLLSCADALASVMTWLVRLFASLPYASVAVSTPNVVEIVLFYVFIVSVVNLKRARTYGYVALLALLALGGAQAWRLRAGAGEGLLRVTFISVGQGDSALIEFPRGSTMLIDAGGRYASGFDIGEGVVSPLLRRKGIRKIDYLVLSHPQLDHMGGMGFIARNFRIGRFWYNGEMGARGRDALWEALREAGIRSRVVDAGTKPTEIDGVRVEFLNPPGGAGGRGLETNDRSLVLRLTYGRRAVLFTGDVGPAAEALLVKQDIKADVVKVPHHGSRYSSSSAFIERTRAGVAVFSVGRYNAFGFPHAETILRYASRAAHLYRTDLDGAVTVTTDGASLRASGYLTGERR